MDINIEEELDEIEKQDGVRLSKEEYIKQSQESRSKYEQESKRYIARCRKQLYDLVKYNTKSGEIFEIFSEWTPDTIKLKPPQEIRVIKIDEVLTSKLLDMQDRVKIKIQNI